MLLVCTWLFESLLKWFTALLMLLAVYLIIISIIGLVLGHYTATLILTRLLLFPL